MALRSLRVERFRGVRSAEVSFDRTTVLIGENDCGMSSVLGALACALSPSAERPVFSGRDFHGGSGPIDIQLAFVESGAGSWDRPGLEALAPVIGPRVKRLRRLTLQITAESPGAQAHWVVRSHGAPSRDDVTVLATIRRINPMVWLHRGAIVRGSLEPGSIATGSESGFAATKRLLSEWVPDTRSRGNGMRAIVAEILEHGARKAQRPASSPSEVTGPMRSGSAAQELGVFVVAAALVHELRQTSAPGVRPIIIFEEPETNLHPMTLASVWGLLELFSAQKIITTHSGSLLAAATLQSLRRLVNENGVLRERRVARNAMNTDDLRKVGYHLRTRRSIACFARVWLLVEGETEFWIMPDLARLCGHDLAQEGVVCVEFAQCGLVPLIKLADSLGIEWHVLTDGDRAGEQYAQTVQPYLRNGDAELRLTRIAEPDIEHCFWEHGYATVFERLARRSRHDAKPTKIIKKAIEKHSKPAVAFELLAAVAANGRDGAPPQLRAAIERCVSLARRSAGPGDNTRAKMDQLEAIEL